MFRPKYYFENEFSRFEMILKECPHQKIQWKRIRF